MQPLFYVIAIMGCSDGSQACQQQRVEPAHYLSMQACQEAMPDALHRNSDIDSPSIAATCRASGPVYADRNAKNERG